MNDAYRGFFWTALARNPVRQTARVAAFQLRWLSVLRLADTARLRRAIKCGASIVPLSALLRPPSHSYRGYAGPWIEDYFFRYWLREAPQTAVTYLPVFWTDLYLQIQTQRLTPSQHTRFAREIRQLLDEGLDEQRCYFTVLEYDHMIWDWHMFPRNVAVFSAGGWGDIPVPLLKGSPRFTCPPKDIPLSFLGRLDGASNVTGIRTRMYDALHDHALFATGRNWRKIMRRSTFSLCPRGLGRTSFRLYEALSVGSIPIYLWDDHRWLPYENELDWSEFAVSLNIAEVDRLPAILATYTPAKIASMQRRIAEVYDEYFTLAGACRQIRRRVELLANRQQFAQLMYQRPYPAGTTPTRQIPPSLLRS